VSPLSQSQIAAIVNPGLNGWFAASGAEINDNGCAPLDQGRDAATVGASPQNPYLLQREFNNAGAIESDPNAPKCTPSVALAPSFVAPSAVNPGDIVELDGSTTVSSLIVPKANYTWTFGDGTPTATGPSVSHSYTAGGTYSVKLTVTDRGGNAGTITQTITVLGPSGGSPTPTSGLRANIRLMPQGLKTVLRSGVALKVISNAAADGIATLTIPRSAATRAHLKVGRGPAVVIGRGTVSGIKVGTTSLRLHLSRAVAAKLGRLRQVVMTVHLKLVATGGQHFAIDVAGHY
jgi:hypothetical protein